MGTIVDVSEILLELGLSDSVTDEERALADMAITRVEGLVKAHLKYDPVQRTRIEYYPQQDFNLDARVAIWEATTTEAYLRRRTSAANVDLLIQHIPIRSVSDLREDYDGRFGTRAGSFGADTAKVEGTDFWPMYEGQDADGNSLCRSGVIRKVGSWPTTPGSVRITYVGGYDDDELHGRGGIVDASPIVDVIISEASRKAKNALVNMKTTSGWAAGPMESERLGDYSYKTGGLSTSRLFGGEWGLMPDSMERLAEFVHYGWGY